MQIKKLLSALLAGCTAASVLGAMPASTGGALDPNILTFDLRSGESNTVTVSAAEISDGDYAVPVDIYVPKNTGVNAISLKFQVNDGEIDQDNVFQNYGFYLSDGALANPYCFDSKNGGNPFAAFSSTFNYQRMNLSWIYSSSIDTDADAAAEAGTTDWYLPEWAYDYAFASATLVIPQGTPAGEYVFDIRTEEYVNAMSGSTAKYGKSQCTNADQQEVDFVSYPLVINITEETTTTTTTTETTTTTTGTETTAATTVTTEQQTDAVFSVDHVDIDSNDIQHFGITVRVRDLPRYGSLGCIISYDNTVMTPVLDGEYNPEVDFGSAAATGRNVRLNEDKGLLSAAFIDSNSAGAGVEDGILFTAYFDLLESAAIPGAEYKVELTVDTFIDSNYNAIGYEVWSTGTITVLEFDTTTTTTTTETTTITTSTTTTTTTTLTETTTTMTTTSEAVTTTTTTQKPAVSEWKDSYDGVEDGHYYIMGDVCGAPGETVRVPVYVFGDTGTAGVALSFTYNQALKLETIGVDRTNLAYPLTPEANVEKYPASFFGVTSGGINMVAEDGAMVIFLDFTIPADAAENTTYAVGFFREGTTGQDRLEVVNTDGKSVNVSFYDGSITVVSEGTTALNRTSYNFSAVGQSVNLTLFHAFGDVTWRSTDESVATVDQNGYVRATGFGSCSIIAENNGTEYICSILVGLFGDVDGNGKITSADAQMVLIEATYVMLGRDATFSDEQTAVGDVNGDGIINAMDAQVILMYYVYNSVISRGTTWYEITGNPNAPDAP